MLQQLPIEILSQIFAEAIAHDQSIGPVLALLSRSLESVVRPVLYRHVHLSETRSMNKFTKLMKKKRTEVKYADLVHGITVRHIEDSMDVDRLDEDITSDAWERLIEQIWKLAESHKLTMLALASEAIGDVQYTDFIQDHLAKDGKRLPLDHLVLCRPYGNAAPLRIFKPKRLTIYHCGHYVEKMALGDVLRSMKWIKEVSLMSGNNVKFDPEIHEEEEDVSGVDWRVAAFLDPELMRLLLKRGAVLNVFLHQKSDDLPSKIAAELQKDENEEYRETVKVGRWGSLSDAVQEQAEEKSLRDGRWNRQGYFTDPDWSAPIKVASKEQGKKKGKDRSTTAAPASRNESTTALRCSCDKTSAASRHDYGYDDEDDWRYGSDGGGADMSTLAAMGMFDGEGGGFDEEAYDDMHGYRAFDMACLSGDVPSWVIDRYAM
jgi:hypothetical protein